MAKRNMRFEGDEVLRRTSRPVDSFDKRLHQLLDDMADTLEEHNGVGLAAVQVGILKRVFIVDLGEGVTEFINPRIMESSGEQVGPEGCLSYPGEYGIVSRPNHVRITAQDRYGKWFEAEGDELYARAVFHENDHLDGVVFKDHAQRMLTDEELALEEE